MSVQEIKQQWEGETGPSLTVTEDIRKSVQPQEKHRQGCDPCHLPRALRIHNFINCNYAINSSIKLLFGLKETIYQTWHAVLSTGMQGCNPSTLEEAGGGESEATRGCRESLVLKNTKEAKHSK